MSTASSRSRRQRSPPGSLLACWVIKPESSAVHMSMAAGSVMPISANAFCPRLNHLEGRRVGIGGRLETGNHPPEHQLEPRWVLHCEVEEHHRHCAQPVPGLVRQRRGPAELEELAVGLAEHRVVDVVLRREVHVQRRRAHANSRGKLAQRPARQALLVGQGPRGGEDLAARGLMSLAPLVHALTLTMFGNTLADRPPR